MSTVMKHLRAFLAAVLPAAASVLLATCGLDQLTSGSTLADIALSTDTSVVIGATKTLVAAAVDGTPLGDLHITWTSSNTAVATVDATGIVAGVGEGTALVTATLTAPELPPEGLTASRTIVVGFGGLVVTPIDSLTGLGQSVTPTVRGTNAASTPVTVVTPTLTSSDPTVLAVVGSAIVARRNGTATITAAYNGLSAPVTVKVRQVAKRITFAASPFVFRSLARDTSVAVTVLDTRDSIMATPAITWSSQNVAVATVSAAGVMRALQVAATTIRAVVDTAVGNLGVSVTQSPSSISKTAGDGQTQTSGAAVTTLPTVTVTDAGGAPVAGAAVTFSVASGGGTITGAGQTSDATGKATVGSWTLGTTSGSNSLLATVGTLSTTFGATGVAGAASQLAIQQAPSGTNSVGAMLAPALQITVRDANNNLVTTATTAIDVALASNPGSATLGGTTTVSAVAGVAAFGDLTISTPGAGYTLAVTATGLTGATTSAFTVVGPATKLAFTVQPSNVTAGASIAPAIQVTVQDAAGNTITGAANPITLAIGTNPGTGTLTGGGATAATNGVASFAAVSVDRSGSGYTITATSAGLTTATSSTFNVVAGAASKLVYLVQPSNTSPATAMTPAVQVAVTDALGNTVTTSTVTVTMAIGTNPASGALAGTTSVAAVAGVASFPTLQINNVGNGYTLAASSTGLTGTTSNAFNIVGAGTPRALKFVTQPSNAVAGVSIAPAITVKVVDSVGTTVNASTASVTLSFGANPNSGTLSGTVTANAVAGVATFSTAKVNRAGGGYTLAATSTGLTPDTSAAFTISAGTASALSFSVQPTSVIAGAAIAPAVQVSVTDNQGNVVTSSTASIALAIGANPGTSTLTGGGAVAAVSGVATFAGLSLNKAANGYTLAATSTGLTAATSSGFNVTAGAPAVLVITTQPASSVAVGATLGAVVVTVRDAIGNTVTSATTPVTLQLLNNPTGATLGGTPTISATAGVATFTTLTVNRAGQGYTFVATAAGLVSDTTTSFNAIGPAAALFFTTQPSTSIRNGAMTVVVEGRDSAGNRATGASNSVTIAIGTNPGAGALSGTATKNLSAGVATFTNLAIDSAGTGYTLTASATLVTGAISTAFDINAFGPATQLAFVAQPTNADAGAAISPDIVVTVKDAQGNTVTNSSATVTLAFGANPGSSTLGGSVSVAAMNGIATFTGTTVSNPGTGYTLTATSGSLTAANSLTFNVVAPGSPLGLAFAQPPTNTSAGSTLLPVVRVCAVNSSNAVVTTYGGNISVVVDSGPASATISGGGTTAAVSGCASFPTLQLTKAGTYHLRGLSSGLTSTASPSFTVSPGPAITTAFLTPISSTTAGQTFPAIQIAVQDAFGNTVTTASNTITIGAPNCINFRPAYGPCLVGSLSSAAVGGIATFTTLRPRRVFLGLLQASATGLTTAISAGYIISPSSPYALDFFNDSHPAASGAGNNAVFANGGPIVLSAYVIDSLGNDVQVTNSIVVSIALGSNPTGATLSGVTSRLHTSQVLDFGQARLDLVGTGYTIVASAPGLAPDTTLPFQVILGAPFQLAFDVQPVATPSGGTVTPAVRVSVRDAYGNLVPTASGSITLGLGNNPGSSSLSGTKTIAIVNGVATFADLSIGIAGSGYTLSATTSVTGLLGVFLSAPFDITP